MSRVGRKVIVVPAGVKVQVGANALEVQGPKGKLSTPVPAGIKFALEGQQHSCQRSSEPSPRSATRTGRPRPPT